MSNDIVFAKNMSNENKIIQLKFQIYNNESKKPVIIIIKIVPSL